MFGRLALGVLLLAVVAPCVGAQSNASQTQVRYLSGTGKDDGVEWDFFCTGGRRSGTWTKIPVPSHWEQHGFGGYNFGRPHDEKTNPLAREQGKYRRRFDVPAEWRGRVVRLVFDGVMTDAEVCGQRPVSRPRASRLLLPFQVRHHAAPEIRRAEPAGSHRQQGLRERERQPRRALPRGLLGLRRHLPPGLPRSPARGLHRLDGD